MLKELSFSTWRSEGSEGSHQFVYIPEDTDRTGGNRHKITSNSIWTLFNYKGSQGLAETSHRDFGVSSCRDMQNTQKNMSLCNPLQMNLLEHGVWTRQSQEGLANLHRSIIQQIFLYLFHDTYNTWLFS